MFISFVWGVFVRGVFGKGVLSRGFLSGGLCLGGFVRGFFVLIPFDIPTGSKVMAQWAIMLNRVEEDLPSISDVARVDNIEIREIMENAASSTDNLIKQLDRESSEDLPLCKLLSMDKQLRSIRVGSKLKWQRRLS